MLRHLRERSYYWLTNYLPDKETADNAWFSVIDGMLYTIMVGLTQPFMNLYAMALGASDPMLGFLASWPALVGLLAQFPSAIFTERLHQIRTSLLRWGFAHRINYLFFALIPFLPLSGVNKAWIFIILVTAMNFPAVVVNTMWTQLMGKLFPGRARAQVFADRSFLVSIVTLIFLLISGPILDAIPYPYNFSTVFGIGFLALMASLYSVSRLKEKQVISYSPLDEEEQPLPAAKVSPFSGMSSVLKDKPFLALTFALFVMHIGFGISGAMWTIFYRRQLLLSGTEIARISIISTATTVIWYRFVPRIIERVGSKGAFLLGIALYAPFPFLIASVNPENLWPLWFYCIFDGLAGATYNLSFFNVILESAHDEAHRPSYLAFFNTCISLPGVIFPMIGIEIFMRLGGIDARPVFRIAGSVRILAVLLFGGILMYTRKKEKGSA